jgi:hypothetical protein
MTVDVSKIREGDEVTIRAIVLAKPRNAFPPTEWQLCWPGQPSATFWGYEENFVGHKPTPKPLKVGDRVQAAAHVKTWQGKPHRGAIRAIEGGDAWVRWDHLEREPYSTDNIWPLSDLEASDGAPGEGIEQ